MSGLSSILSLAGRAPTVLRTLRHVRPVQAGAQIRHMLAGLATPRRVADASPQLALEGSYSAFLPPPAHVRGGASQIELLSTPFVLGERIDWESQTHGPLFAYHLHQQEYLRLPSFDSATRARRIREWIEDHPAGIGWDPHPISLRLICWGRLLLTPGALDPDPAFRASMLASMTDQAETLAHGLEVRLQGNHLLSNLISIVFVGLLIESAQAESWRDKADQLMRELDAQVHPDGGHEERSPMYHALILENVLDLLNLCRADEGRAPAGLSEALSATASRMLTALGVLSHPDGRIALFADSAFEIAAEPEALREYASRLEVPVATGAPGASTSAYLPQTGYLRLAAGPWVLISSAGGPSPAHQPGHAHCDALSFELSVGGARLVTDTGVFEYQVGPRRDWARATSSHATLEFDGREQAEIWAAHRVGGRPVVELCAWDEAGTAEVKCRGWSRGAPTHRRLFLVDASSVEIVDHVVGSCREAINRLPLDPDWVVEWVEGGVRARRADADGGEQVVRIDLPGEYAWTIEQAPSYPSFGRERERPVLVGRALGRVRSTIRVTREDLGALDAIPPGPVRL